MSDVLNPAFDLTNENDEFEKCREHASISDYESRDFFSLIESAFLWFDLKPNENKFHTEAPKKVLSIAKVINH